ncbi:MAG: endonuclease MutS2 [Lachnospiraceae bacterium]|nr:endonuclease MutS2 [Lachnospiraceae bacterium]
MNDKVFKTLEYDKIIMMLADRADSLPGKEKCRNLLPDNELKEVTERQQETFDAVGRLLRNGSVSFGSNKPIDTILLRLEKGSAIGSGELLVIAGLLENTARVRSYGYNSDEEDQDSLSEMFKALTPLKNVSANIRRCIVGTDEIDDNASSELKNIRRLIRVMQDKVHARLNSMVNNTYKAYLQDSVVTMREGRYCIPVKAEYKNNVPGMVHDRSSTASTFFIEPSEVVNLNNEIRELEIREAREIERILSVLSADCAEHTEELRINVQLMTELDFIFAKGQLGLDMNGSRPVHNAEGIIDIKKARHPLISKDKVVPIDIRLGEDFDLLIITGPNTGGKTVALKTLGLLTLMGQAGLMIPASDHSRLGIFDDVFADIGDEQSIEQSLSTFSSHLRTIVNIIENADEKSLCLFDELGAGTDPTEGAALATAILDRIHKCGIKTAATTHYSELKVYALREEGVCNASCEFNVETLAPTYRLLIGIPGKSNAFAIAGKLGLRPDIIENAKERISEQDESFEDVISELEEGRRIIELEKAEVQKYKDEIEKLKADYEQKSDRLKKQREDILNEAHREASVILAEAKESADEAIRNFQKHGTIQELEKERTKLRDKLNKNRGTGSMDVNNIGKIENKLSDFKLGENVKILSMGLKGTVNTLPDNKGNLFVQCGIMRLKANMNDIVFLDTPDITGAGMEGVNTKGRNKHSNKSVSYTGGSLSKAASMSIELNIIGCTTDEAIPKLEKYLDDAYLSHLESVRIVHGKGTGALRKAVWNRLKNIKYVKSYEFAGYGEGDAGVTVVTFK